MQYGHWLHDMVLVKFSSTGSRLWEALWRRDSLEDWVYDLAMGPDGSVYICGSTQDRTHGSLAVLAKYDSLGTMRWEATLHGPGVGSANVFNDVEVDRRGDVLVAGAYTTTNTDVDFLVAKYPPSGPGVAERELDRALPGQLPVVTPSLVSRSCRFTVVRLNGTSGIAVSDIVGRTLRVLVVPAGRAGERVSVIWDSRDDAGQPVPNGVYFVTVVGSGIGASSKVVVQR